LTKSGSARPSTWRCDRPLPACLQSIRQTGCADKERRRYPGLVCVPRPSMAVSKSPVFGQLKVHTLREVRSGSGAMTWRGSLLLQPDASSSSGFPQAKGLALRHHDAVMKNAVGDRHRGRFIGQEAAPLIERPVCTAACPTRTRRCDFPVPAGPTGQRFSLARIHSGPAT
jgi:hypothetical protein